VAAYFLRQRRIRDRRRTTDPVTDQWQIPELASEAGVDQKANYNVDQRYYGGMDNRNPQAGGGGGLPLAEVYTPGNEPQKAGYQAFVPVHVELPESAPAYNAESSNATLVSSSNKARSGNGGGDVFG